jgi:RNA polymerase sigma factor (sigma-70 family)
MSWCLVGSEMCIRDSDRAAGVQQQVEDQDTWNWVERIMNELPEQQRLIVQLRDIEEMEFDKIAEILNSNEQAIRTALSRARKTIRERMQKTHQYGTQ